MFQDLTSRIRSAVILTLRKKMLAIGSACIVVRGPISSREDHPEAVADLALDMQVEPATLNADADQAIGLYVGINTGPVVAGVIGTKKFIYDCGAMP